MGAREEAVVPFKLISTCFIVKAELPVTKS